MGYPSDEKSPDGLPTHTAVPFGVPPGGASIWAETPRERSRRRCGIVGKHIAVLLAAFFGLLYAHKTFKVFAHVRVMLRCPVPSIVAHLVAVVQI